MIDSQVDGPSTELCGADTAAHHAERYQRALQGVNRILTQAIRAESVEALASTCLQVALELTGSALGLLGEVGADGLLHELASQGLASQGLGSQGLGANPCHRGDQAGHRHPPDGFSRQGLYGRPLQDGKSLLTNDPASHPANTGLPPGYPALTAFLGIPLVQDERACGVLAVANREGGYGPQQQEDLEALAPTIVECLHRGRAEAALRESEERFRLLMDHSPTIAWVKDEAGRYVYLSPSYQERFGVRPDDWRGKADADLWPAEVGERFHHNDQAVLVADQATRATVEASDAEGHRTSWLSTECSFRDTAGKRFVAGIGVDITEHRQAEERLRQALAKAEGSERMLSALMEYIPEGITISDAALNLTRVSRYAEALLGGPHEARPAAEVVTDWRVYQADGQTPMALEDLPLARAVQRGEVVTGVEVVQVNARGERLPLLCNAGPIRDAAGNILGGIVAWRDITERVRVREALAKSEARYRSLFESMSEGFFVAELLYDDSGRPRDYRFLEVNGAYEALTRLSRQDTIGRALRELFPQDAARWLEALAPVFRGVPIRQEQYASVADRYYQLFAYPVGGDRFACLFTDITERRHTEEAVRQSEERFRALVETTSDFIWEMDARGAYTYCSPQLHTLWGFDPQEFIGTSPFDRLPPEDRERALHAFSAQANSPVAIRSIEMHGLDAAGNALLLEVSGVPFYDAAGALKGYRGITRDVTEQRQAEEALRLAHERTYAILESISDSFIALDRQWRFLYANQRALGYSGMRPADVLGKTIWEAFPQIVGTPLEHFYRQAMASSESLIYTNPSTVVVGRLFELHAYPTADGLTLIGQDVTERVRAEEALRESEEQRVITKALVAERQRFLDVLETIPAMVCLLTPDYHVDFANRSFRATFGEANGRHCYEYCYERHEPCEFCQTYRVLETGQPHHWEVVGPDGRVIDAYDFPFTDVDGSPMILEMDIDITESRQAQSALVQAERLAAVGRLTATLAHEINNPLQAVIGCLGLAREALPEGTDSVQYLEMATEELERAAHIVRRIRDLGGQQEAARELAAVGELIAKVVTLVEERARSQGVRVVWEADAQLPSVPMMRDRIDQVFLNLVLNAIDAMPTGGQLRIAAARTAEPPGVLITFADTGVGISPEGMTRLFQAFHTTKPLELGLGLGLHISRSIIEEHGGTIEAQSEVGRGTTFKVWLPTA